MATSKEQAAFDLSIALYNQCSQLVAEMCTHFADNSVTHTKQMALFDAVLQTVLYRIAIEDGVVAGNEKYFLEHITQYSDLMQAVSASTGKPFTWDFAATLPQTERVKFAKLLENFIDKAANAFVVPFALLDAIITERDYLKELDNLIVQICACFTMVDGNSTQAELQAAGSTYGRVLNAKWQYVRANVKKG